MDSAVGSEAIREQISGCMLPRSTTHKMRSPLINYRTATFAAMLALFAAVLSVQSHAGAQESRLPKRAGHINDFAEVLDAPTKERLEKILENLKAKTNVDF